MVRALASHQCGPGSIPGLGVICGLSLLLFLVFAPRGFSPGNPVFPSPQTPTFPKPIRSGNQGHRFVSRNSLLTVTLVKQKFTYLLIDFIAAVDLFFSVWSGGDSSCLSDRTLSSNAESLQRARCARNMHYSVLTRTLLCDTRELLTVHDDCQLIPHKTVIIVAAILLLSVCSKSSSLS